jgi:hypothetical protein
VGLGITRDPGGPERLSERNGNMVEFNGSDFHGLPFLSEWMGLNSKPRLG